MGAPKGRKPPNAGKGRPKGSPNKIAACMKEEVLRVYNELQSIEGCQFSDWAQKNKDQFYILFIRDLLPKQLAVAGENGGPIKLLMEIVKNESDKV
jgi:hypothetical protein